MIREMNKQTDMISSIVHEYLLKKEYNRTLETFQDELALKINNKIYYQTSFWDINENALLKLLSWGNKIHFFKLWNRMIPMHIKLRDNEWIKTEFYVNWYFAIYPWLYKVNKQSSNKTVKESMNEFKEYLEKNETELSKNTEFIEFYALPYIPNPQTHQVYMKLFTPEWTGWWKDKIRDNVKNYLPSIKYPVWYDWIISNTGSSGSGNSNTINNDDENANNISTRGPSKIELMRTFFESWTRKGNDELLHNLSFNNINSLNNTIQNNINLKTQTINNMVNNPPIFMNNNIPQFNNEANDDYIKMRDDYVRWKQTDKVRRISFMNSQRSWTNWSLNILAHCFSLMSICKSNRSMSDINLQTDKINKKLLKYQAFLKNNLEEVERFFKSNSSNNNNNTVISLRERNEDFLDNIQNSKYLDMSNVADVSIFDNNNINNNNSNNNQKTNILGIINEYEPSHCIDMISFTSALKHIAKSSKEPAQIDDEKLSAVLREIRWRTFRRNNQKIKRVTLYSIFYYDLVHSNSWISFLLNSPASYPITTIELMKIVNQWSSLTKGRNYWLMNKHSSTLIEDIIRCMYNENGDTELRQICWGVIQKFTWRWEPQDKLISLDLIKWWVNIFIYEQKTWSDYSIEYGLALIMNLSLRKEGRDKFEEENEKIMQILINYMSKDNLQIQTCINGTLYSLIKRQKLKEAAKKFKIDNILLNTPITNQQLKKQMSYIWDELNSPEILNTNEDEDENFEEDINCVNDDNNANEDYAELDSIDQEGLNQHYKYLSEYIIRNDDVNNEEEIKLENYSKANPNMTIGEVKGGNNGSTVNNMSNIMEQPINQRGVEGKQLVLGLNNKSMEGSKVNPINEKKEEKDIDNIEQAFLKKDRLIRTPPDEIK